MRLLALLGCISLSIVCSACNFGQLITDLETHSDLGEIRPGPDQSGMKAPDTVSRGTPFTVSINTYGNACLRGADRTEVSYPAGDTAVVRPFDNVTLGPCGGDVLKIVPHVATVSFANAGPAAVRFEGLSRNANGTVATTSIEHAVVVR